MKPVPLAAAFAILAAPAFADSWRGDHSGMRGEGPMRIFQEADANSDDAVSRDELAAWRDARFADADADNDGFVTSDELYAAMVARMEEQTRRRARMMIAAMDGNEDGRIAADELPSERMTRMFDRLDRNDDGQVTSKEMREMRGRHRGSWRGRGD